MSHSLSTLLVRSGLLDLGNKANNILEAIGASLRLIGSLHMDARLPMLELGPGLRIHLGRRIRRSVNQVLSKSNVLTHVTRVSFCNLIRDPSRKNNLQLK